MSRLSARLQTPAPSSIVGSLPSLFGKTDAQGDFVRIRTASAAATFTQQWIMEAHERRVAAGAPWPEQIVRFVITPPTTESVVVGALTASRDSVGRAFPLAMFAEVLLPMGMRVDAIPVAAQKFVDAASQVLADSGSATPAGLEERARAMGPVLDDPNVALATCETARRRERVADFVARCFGTGGDGALAYALDTVVQAAGLSASTDARGGDRVLACPLTIDVDLFAWLSILGAACPSARASFTWTEDEPSMLATYGAPSAGLLAFVGRLDSRSSSLWPLTTTRVASRHEAIARLPHDVLASETLEDLVSRLGRGRSRR